MRNRKIETFMTKEYYCAAEAPYGHRPGAMKIRSQRTKSIAKYHMVQCSIGNGNTFKTLILEVINRIEVCRGNPHLSIVSQYESSRARISLLFSLPYLLDI